MILTIPLQYTNHNYAVKKSTKMQCGKNKKKFKKSAQVQKLNERKKEQKKFAMNK